MFLTDFYRVKYNLPPISVYTNRDKIYMDGGSHESFGIGYKVNVYKTTRSKETKYEIGFYTMAFKLDEFHQQQYDEYIKETNKK